MMIQTKTLEALTPRQEHAFKQALKADYTLDLDHIGLIDIETTGFSPKYQSVYLIGLLVFDNGVPKLTQWLAQSEPDEYTLLYTCQKALSQLKVLFHFNGLGFDMPFLKTRMALYQIPCDWSHMIQKDIYLDVKPLGYLLPTENLKQKTLETYMNLHRKDLYSGGALIEVYKRYLEQPEDVTTLQDLLLLHNLEDVLGLFHLVNLYPLIRYYEQLKTCEDVVILNLNHHPPYLNIDMDLPAGFHATFKLKAFTLYCHPDHLSITIPVLYDTLKHFYKDYEQYYFLTQEGYAVHKSVGALVDRAYRKPAKKSNCFSQKTGAFIPLFHEAPLEPIFVKAYRDKAFYIEITDRFLEDTDQLVTYVLNLLGHL